ncbi:MAG: endonuclease/exonuclease/phosphatase family protein [Caldilineaceae bacterium]
MRIVSWNIRSGGGRRVDAIADQIVRWRADVAALCEFRGTPPSQQLAQRLGNAGLRHQLSTADPDQRARNALLLASRFPLTAVNLPQAPTEPARWLLAHIAAPMPFHMGVMHVPNFVTKRKFPFHDAVLDVAEVWPWGPALFIGDTNTGLSGIDDETRVFTQREEAWMHRLEELAWCDVFRKLHGEKRVYTWYSPNGGNGFRLDQAFVNPQLVTRVTAMHYVWGEAHKPQKQKRRDALSDHAAILLDLA